MERKAKKVCESEAEPVSYTHLDVYKRQFQIHTTAVNINRIT